MEFFVLQEENNSSSTTPTPKKKYKCPYCDGRYEREKLHIHIQNKHEDLIPEGYTALRVAFNTINHKDHGSCIICGNETDWNEQKGRYERLCNNPACKEKYKQMAAERNRRIYGTDRLQNDPRYAEEVQRKALAGRKSSGKYKFKDGGEVGYMGTYEKLFLQFMDQVMECKSEDILAPGPAIQYPYNGEKHLYLPDFYYIPYNLIIEVKDGGDNPNNHSHRTGEDEARLQAKEAFIKRQKKYNYVRQVNNDFSQVMKMMAILKYRMYDGEDSPVVKIFESSILESYLINEKDIYYHKKEFDSGEINLCFITGHSGSGKTTMGKNMQGDKIEHYELDDLLYIKDHFTMDNLKEYGDLIYSYFNGPGKKFYLTEKELIDKKIPGSEYKDKLYPGFVHYAMNYAKNHKDRKFVIEGVWLFCDDDNGSPMFKPEEFKDYAFYIKGTSMIISKHRAAKRDAKDTESKKEELSSYFRGFFKKNWKFYLIDEKAINSFRNYFKKLIVNEYNISWIYKEDGMLEDMSGTIGAALPLNPIPTPYESDPDNYYYVQLPQNMTFIGSITKDPTQHTMLTAEIDKNGHYKVKSKENKDFSDNYVTFKIKDKQKAKDLYDELAYICKNNNYIYSEESHNDYIYWKLTGKELLKEDQVIFDTNNFELVKNFNDQLLEDCNEFYRWLKNDPIITLEEQVKDIEETYLNEFNLYEVLSDDINDIEDLIRWKHRFDSMTHYQKIISDDMSIAQYGENNIDRYNKKYAELIDNVDPNKSISESGEAIDTQDYNDWNYRIERARLAEKDGLIIMVNTSDDDQSYNNEDKIYVLKKKFEAFQNLPENKRILSNQTCQDIFGCDNYVLYERILNKYLSRQDPLTDKDTINQVNGNISSPEYMDLTTGLENPVLQEKFNNTNWSNCIEINVEEYLKNEIDLILENYSKTLSGSVVPIFICLTSGNSLFSYGIKKFTNSEWSHASIGFDSSLSKLYTFTAAYTDEEDGKIKSGFYYDSLKLHLKQDPDRKAKLYILFVKPSQKKKMEEAVEWYIKNQDKTKYDWGAIRRIFQNKQVSSTDKGTMICSQFVYSILQIAKIKFYKNGYVTPEDLDHIEDNRLFIVFEDKLKTYKKSKIDNLCKKLLTVFEANRSDIANESFVEISDVESYITEKSQEALQKVPKYLTSEYLKDKIVPVFVCLCKGSQLHSLGIRWFTDSEWSHASIGFDSSLNELYTFTVYKEDGKIFKTVKNGFSIDNLKRYKSIGVEKIKLYALFVLPEQRDAMQEAVKWYMEHQEETRYNFKGIFDIFRRKPKSTDKGKMICSQFVYTILQIAKLYMRKNKPASDISPADLDELIDDARFYCVYQGDIDNYKKKNVDDLCYRLLPTLPMEQYGISESNNIILSPISAIGKNHNRILEMSKFILENR